MAFPKLRFRKFSLGPTLSAAQGETPILKELPWPT